jgi:hypothetical protein
VALLTASIATAQPRDYLVDVWDTERGLPSSLVASLAQTPQGYLWVATQNGLLRFDGLRFVAFDPDNTPELPHVPQPLKNEMVNHPPLILRKSNKAVDWTTYELARTIIISKVSNIGHVDYGIDVERKNIPSVNVIGRKGRAGPL